MTEYSNLNFAAAVVELLTSDWSVKGYQDRCHFSMSLVKICLESFCFCWVFLLLPQSQERFSLLLLSLFCNKRFMLDEMIYQNDSKFAKFVDYENQFKWIPFLFYSVLFFIFFPINLDHDIRKRKKLKWHKMNNN